MLTLRRYEPSDYEEVWQLHKVALESINAYISDSSLDDDLKAVEATYPARRGEFLVGLLEQKLVAMGALREVVDSTGNTAEVKRMRVHPEYQRRGYGEQMLVQLEEMAARLGYKRLVLDTSTAQVAAQSLYRNHGYNEVRRERVQGLELIYLEKRL